MLPKIVVGIYLLLVALSVLPLLIPISPHGPLAGIFAIMLASPWIQIILPIVQNLAISLGLSVVINAAILYLLTRVIVSWL